MSWSDEASPASETRLEDRKTAGDRLEHGLAVALAVSSVSWDVQERGTSSSVLTAAQGCRSVRRRAASADPMTRRAGPKVLANGRRMFLRRLWLGRRLRSRRVRRQRVSRPGAAIEPPAGLDDRRLDRDPRLLDLGPCRSCARCEPIPLSSYPPGADFHVLYHVDLPPEPRRGACRRPRAHHRPGRPDQLGHRRAARRHGSGAARGPGTSETHRVDDRRQAAHRRRRRLEPRRRDHPPRGQDDRPRGVPDPDRSGGYRDQRRRSPRLALRLLRLARGRLRLPLVHGEDQQDSEAAHASRRSARHHARSRHSSTASRSTGRPSTATGPSAIATNGNAQRLDDSVGGKVMYGPFVHTFNALVPPEQYFDTHPEYFSHGERQADEGLLSALPDQSRRAEDQHRTSAAVDQGEPEGDHLLGVAERHRRSLPV